MTAPRVVVADGAEGLAVMLAGLLGNPDKANVLAAMRGTVTIAVPDAEVEVGLRFAEGVCHVSGAAIAGSAVRIEMPSETLMEFPTIPLMLGLPSVLTPAGRAFTRQMLTRQVKIRGLQHIKLITQLNTVLSVV